MPNAQDDKQIQALGQRIVAHAAQKLGGVAAMAKFLGLSEATVGDFITGKHVPPVEVILKAVETLLDDPAAIWRQTDQRPPASR